MGNVFIETTCQLYTYIELNRKKNEVLKLDPRIHSHWVGQYNVI